MLGSRFSRFEESGTDREGSSNRACLGGGLRASEETPGVLLARAGGWPRAGKPTPGRFKSPLSGGDGRRAGVGG